MDLEINLKGNILDYIDQEELEDDIRDKINYLIKDAVMKLVDDNKEEIKQELINKLTVSILSNMELAKPIESLLFDKIVEGINNRYPKDDSFNMAYDIKLSGILTKLYNENKEVFDKCLTEKLEEAIHKYNPSNYDYIISDQVTTLLLENNNLKQQLKDVLNEKIEYILTNI